MEEDEAEVAEEEGGATAEISSKAIYAVLRERSAFCFHLIVTAEVLFIWVV